MAFDQLRAGILAVELGPSLVSLRRLADPFPTPSRLPPAGL